MFVKNLEHQFTIFAHKWKNTNVFFCYIKFELKSCEIAIQPLAIGVQLWYSHNIVT